MNKCLGDNAESWAEEWENSECLELLRYNLELFPLYLQ